MIIIIHKEARKVLRVISDDENDIDFYHQNITEIFWELVENFQDQLIIWCEEKIFPYINIKESCEAVFYNKYVMASFGINTCFLPESIGFVDQLPFININKKVQYPTWQMSSDIGGAYGQFLVKFKSIYRDVSDFGYLLNCIAKTGQQNGLFCYSAPALVNRSEISSPTPKATTSQLFSFVYQHYSWIWTTILLWCFIKYERKFPVIQYLTAFFSKKRFKYSINLEENEEEINTENFEEFSIDVIIPTLGRREYLYQVLLDLKSQTLLPNKVIIIEQNPNENARTELEYIIQKKWPFIISHYFITQVGACNARNIAMKEVISHWVFFADDDIRINSNILKKAFIELKKYGFNAINFNCKQKDEITVFPKIKQWGGFGSGTSIVKSEFVKQCEFSRIYEHGYGEDTDFGMQLRNIGCDIIYHPHIELLHLKAPIGGFREKPIVPWEYEVPLPKPAPPLMTYIKKYYTKSQIYGFKTQLFLRYYTKQSIINPIVYIKAMKLRWKKSEDWANFLSNKFPS